MLREYDEDDLQFINRVLTSALSEGSKLSLLTSEYHALYNRHVRELTQYKRDFNPDDAFIEIHVPYNQVCELAKQYGAKTMAGNNEPTN